MNLLTRSDKTLEWLKRAICAVNKSTEILKEHNDHVAPVPPLGNASEIPAEHVTAGAGQSAAPETRNARWWKDYGERYEESGW